jgi:hypothetical protein
MKKKNVIEISHRKMSKKVLCAFWYICYLLCSSSRSPWDYYAKKRFLSHLSFLIIRSQKRFHFFFSFAASQAKANAKWHQNLWYNTAASISSSILRLCESYDVPFPSLTLAHLFLLLLVVTQRKRKWEEEE